jgi:hypothetical protein
VADAHPRLPHGYTNSTASDGRTVVKRYLGPDAEARQHREVVALTRLRGLVPVPPLVAAGTGEITLGFVGGRPGQELLEERPEDVLYAVGRLAAEVAAVDVSAVSGLAVSSEVEQAPGRGVLVHGDFGPQNVLLDEATAEPTALLDWEHAHLGHVDEHDDLAWAEWIVRTHHPHLIAALPALFVGYGSEPAWRVRQERMLAKCRWAVDFVDRWSGPDSAGFDLWQRRLAATAAFTPDAASLPRRPS